MKLPIIDLKHAQTNRKVSKRFQRTELFAIKGNIIT